MTFPRNVGQIPIYYNHKRTGRPQGAGPTQKFRSNYLDVQNQPLFPFGYGLSYTNFEYSNSKVATQDGVTTISFNIKNTGKHAGYEVVQLYIHDEIASVARPVKELKAFQRVSLQAGEEKNVSFTITPAMLRILNEKMKWTVEPGKFRIMIGSSSKDIRIREMVELKF